eukprot:gene9870-13277_t
MKVNVVCPMYLLLSCYIFLSQTSVDIQNDDFCDKSNGEDEPRTSACSYISGTSFTCNLGGLIEQTIPASRVSDGVCDCCDGSDEITYLNPSFVGCKNTCDDDYQTIRRTALINHRILQSGMRNRKEKLDKMTQRKRREYREYDVLKQEVFELSNYMFTMRYLITQQYSAERNLRWKLIRERHTKCAGGYDEACDIYASEYIITDELVYEGRRPIELNPKDKFKWQHTPEEIRYLQSLSSLDRVKATICPSKDVLPDDNSRIHTRVGELVTYLSSAAYQKPKELTKIELRKRALFSPFLEDGSRGHLLALQIILEIIGIISSPIILSTHWLLHYFSLFQTFVWDKIIECSDNNQLPLTLRAYCLFIKSSDEDDSRLANILSYIDYNRYSALTSFYDNFQEYFRNQIWMIRYIWLTPTVYFDYFYNKKNILLPPRRQSCLLREGLLAIEKEIIYLQNEIREIEALHHTIQQEKD